MPVITTDETTCRPGMQFWPNLHTEKCTSPTLFIQCPQLSRSYANGSMHVYTDAMHHAAEFDSYELTIELLSNSVPVTTRLLHYRHWTTDADVPNGLMQFQVLMNLTLSYRQLI